MGSRGLMKKDLRAIVKTEASFNGYHYYEIDEDPRNKRVGSRSKHSQFLAFQHVSLQDVQPIWADLDATQILQAPKRYDLHCQRRALQPDGSDGTPPRRLALFPERRHLVNTKRPRLTQLPRLGLLNNMR